MTDLGVPTWPSSTSALPGARRQPRSNGVESAVTRSDKRSSRTSTSPDVLSRSQLLEAYDGEKALSTSANSGWTSSPSDGV